MSLPVVSSRFHYVFTALPAASRVFFTSDEECSIRAILNAIIFFYNSINISPLVMAWYSINLASYKFSKSLFVSIRYFMERTAPHNIRTLITKDSRWEGFHPGTFICTFVIWEGLKESPSPLMVFTQR